MFWYRIFEAASILLIHVGRCGVSALPAGPVVGNLTANPAWTVYVVLPVVSASKAEALDWAQQVVSIDKSAEMEFAYYSQEIETPMNLDIIAGFDCLAAAKTFRMSLHSGPIYRMLKPKLTGPITSHVVQMSPADPLLDLTVAPITEVATFWLPENPSAAVISGFNSAFLNLEAAVTAAQGEFFATSGQVQGKTANPSGRDTLTVLAFAGWQSVSTHITFTQSAAFGAAIAGMVPFISGSKDHHISPTKLSLASARTENFSALANA